jgi:hypothetical protein
MTTYCLERRFDACRCLTFMQHSSRAASSPPSNAWFARVLYDYKSDRPEILSLERGTVVVIYEKITNDW